MNDKIVCISKEITSFRRNIENYKSLKANIDFCEGDPRVIMVTSSVPGEGKSTVSLHLAAEFANSGKKVLLMDCDLRRSNYAKDFHIPREERIGVSDVLKKKATLQEVLLKSDIDNLFFLQAGTVPPNPAELLQSPSFQKIITSLKNVFEYIIVDAPPLASVIDAAIISKCTDGVVYVIASDEISCRVIRRGLEQLERAGARILGTVLNRIKFSNRALYGTYGTNKYYYGYYHGYYGEEE